MAIYRQGNEYSDLPFSAEQLQRDLHRLQQPTRGVAPLPAPANPDPVPTKTAVARDTPDPTGGGISSPLSESDIADREYWTGSYITTSDGLFAWPAIKSMSFTDASGRAVVIEFAEPA